MTADEARKLTAANRKKLLPEPLRDEIAAAAEKGRSEVRIWIGGQWKVEYEFDGDLVRSFGYQVRYDLEDDDGYHKLAIISWED